MMFIKHTSTNEVKFPWILNSLFETKNKKVQADIQVPVPLQSVKSLSQKLLESL